MEVYVDEIPKEAIINDTYLSIGTTKTGTVEGEFDIDGGNIIMEGFELEELKDHDKEVRKQVCDEIRETADGLSYIDYDLDEKSVLFDTLKDILDQIEKGDKE